MAVIKQGYDTYKWPEVQTDPQINLPNAAGIIKKITAEEWADMKRHTHKISDILDSNGNELGSDASGNIVSYDDTEIRNLISQLQNSINTLAQENNLLKQRVQALEQQSGSGGDTTEIENQISGLQNSVSNLTSRVETLENSSSTSEDGLLIDFDPDSPGTQDIHGNTVNN